MGKIYQQFEWYLYAIKADNEPDMRKISLFLTVAGPQAQEVYGTFTYGTDESPKTNADVMNKFIDYCMPKKNLVYERFVFNTCNQNQGQTIDSYVTELRMKAQSSEYDELKDSLIRDRIVVGTNSIKVLQEKGGALYGGTEPVNVIKRDRKRITQKKRYVAPPGETSNCEKCGFKHLPKRCLAYNAICHNCKLKGHYPLSKTMYESS